MTEGKYATGRNTPWLDFTIRYTDEVLSGLAPKTRNQLSTIFNTVERILAPKRLGDVTATRLSRLAGQLRQEHKSEFTVRNYLAHLRAAFAWAVQVKLLAVVPTFPKTPRAKKQKVMKGRPISESEFRAMLLAVPAVVGEAAAESWRYYLTGLWNSGLRLRESVEVYWDRQDKMCVDLSGPFPMLRIPADQQKSGNDQLWAIAPEWGTMLLAVPAEERYGRVFRLLGAPNAHGGRGGGPVSDPDYVSHIVCRIGEKAGIVVNRTTKRDRKTGEPVEVAKFASCHDLRRSFGVRWSTRVMPFQLMELMRHSSIETTKRFYIGRNAQSTAAALWAAHDQAGGSQENTPSATKATTASRLQRPAAIQKRHKPLIRKGLSKYTPQGSNL